MTDVDRAVRSRRALLKYVATVTAIPVMSALLGACGGTAATDTPGATLTSGPGSAPGRTPIPSAAPVASTVTDTTGTASPAASASVAKALGGKLNVWGSVSFTKAGDALLGQQMQDWGKANNVAVEYTVIGTDYLTKVASSIETGSSPDVVMMSGTSTIYYAAQNRLVDLTETYSKLKGLAGGMYETLLPYVQTDGKVYSIPMQADLTVMYARLDLIEKATGNRTVPATIDDIENVARKVNAPPKLYGLGLTLGRTNDTRDGIIALLRAEGGTLVGKDGKPAINNDGTLSALTYVQKWWQDKLIPADSPSWDDTGNNKSYQSRQSAFVINPASIFAYLDQNDKELLKDTQQAPVPKGKAGSFPTVGTWSWSIFSSSKNVDAGKALIETIMQPDKMEAVYEQVGGRWYPVYKDLATAPFWKQRPYFDLFPTAIQGAIPVWAPATANPTLLTQLSALDQKYTLAEMVQDVVVSGKSPQDAAKTAQTKMEQAFAEAAVK